MDDILDAYEFTIPESSLPSPPLQPESVEEDEDEEDSESESDNESDISDDGLFYALAHSSYDLTTSTSSFSNRPESLPPTPRRTSQGPARRSSIPSLRRRRSSLQSLRAASKPVPSSQLDPTFPRRRSSLRSSAPPKPAHLPPPVPSLTSSHPSPPFVRRDSPNSLRNKKSLSIIVPRRGSHDSTASDATCTEASRPPPKESLPNDVFELLDDPSGWVCDYSPSSPSPSHNTDASMTEESEVPRTPTSNSDEEHSSGGRRGRQGSFGLPVPKASPLALNFLEVDVDLSLPYTPSITLAPASSPTSSASPSSSSMPSSTSHSPLNLPYFLRDSYLVGSPSNTSDSFDHEDEENSNWDITNDRVLRSRWSSSTLSTVAGKKEDGSMSALLKSHFHFGKRGRSSASSNKVQVREKASPEKKVPSPIISSPKKSATPDVSFTTSSSPSPTSSFFAPLLSPSAHASRRSSDIPGRAQKRMGMAGMGMGLGMGRMSMDSILSKGNNDSSTSEEGSGVRRKPIPIEIFMRQ